MPGRWRVRRWRLRHRTGRPPVHPTVPNATLAALHALGAGPQHVMRTRIYLTDADACEAVSIAQGRVFAQSRPADTLPQVARLIGPYRMEAEAVLPG